MKLTYICFAIAALCFYVARRAYCISRDNLINELEAKITERIQAGMDGLVELLLIDGADGKPALWASLKQNQLCALKTIFVTLHWSHKYSPPWLVRNAIRRFVWLHRASNNFRVMLGPPLRQEPKIA